MMRINRALDYISSFSEPQNSNIRVEEEGERTRQSSSSFSLANLLLNWSRSFFQLLNQLALAVRLRKGSSQLLSTHVLIKFYTSWFFSKAGATLQNFISLVWQSCGNWVKTGNIATFFLFSPVILDFLSAHPWFSLML